MCLIHGDEPHFRTSQMRNFFGGSITARFPLSLASCVELFGVRVRVRVRVRVSVRVRVTDPSGSLPSRVASLPVLCPSPFQVLWEPLGFLTFLLARL